MRLKGHPSLYEMAVSALDVAAPPPEMTLSQWADTYRMIGSEGGPEPGQWDTERTPYLREPMDTITDARWPKIVLMMGSQLGKSEIMLNAFGYYAHLDPCPMMFVQPDTGTAKDFSKDRIGSMVRDTPVLREKIIDTTMGDGENLILAKRFPGGYLVIASGRSPAQLASKPIRLLLMDEIDRMPKSAGSEGNPVKLAEKRTSSFWNKKHVLGGTPTDKGNSPIENEFDESDQRECFVPCPECEEYQLLEFENLRWEKDSTGRHLPETVKYACGLCGCLVDEIHKVWMISKCRWVAQNPGSSIAGFHLNSLYSPFVSWVEIVKEFLACGGRPDDLKVFYNTRLAVTWEEKGEEIRDENLNSRKEEYPAEVPMGAYVLTAGVDVQKDRVEVEVNGCGDGEECWGVEYAVIWGAPDQKDVWNKLQSYLQRTFQHESGVKLSLSATCIDSSAFTTYVYNFCKGKEGHNIFAIKGDDGPRPIIGPPSKKRTGKEKRPVDLFIVGTDQAKDIIFSRLKLEFPGPGYFHFPKSYNDEYFKQLTGETKIEKHNKTTGSKTFYWKKKRARVEALDCKVYAYAALKMMPKNWEDWKRLIIPDKPMLSLPLKTDPLPGAITETASETRPIVHKRRVRSRGYGH